MSERTYGDYVDGYFVETARIIETLDRGAIVRMMEGLAGLKARQGRLFIMGVGGSAANASHAVNDFRKILGIETYSPCDNFAEFSAWANDSGWSEPFVQWLRESRLSAGDAVLVLSVGGGSATTSVNLVLAMEHAREVGANVFSIVSRDGGRAAALSDVMVLVPVANPDRVTPHAEGMQSVLLHLIVNGVDSVPT